MLVVLTFESCKWLILKLRKSYQYLNLKSMEELSLKHNFLQEMFELKKLVFKLLTESMLLVVYG